MSIIKSINKEVKSLISQLFTFVIIGLISTFSLFLFSSFAVVKEVCIIETSGPIIVEKTPELTPENVYVYLKRLDVKHPTIVLSQSILETGWYECDYCSLQHNNIFGFRYKKEYIKFDNWIESIEYYKKWQDKNYQGGDYFKFLKSVGYATSKTYISKLRQIKLDFLKHH